MLKTIKEINQKIKEGTAVVFTASEMTEMVKQEGAKKAAETVDVVTTGTFGAMCSSGAFLNFGHSDPPIKMAETYLNGVEAYSGLAAVDAYIGAGQGNSNLNIGFDYGGAHVIEDLIKGKDIDLKAKAYGTDCYPLRQIKTSINIETLNQATMINPRNCYQNYAVATNSSAETLHTYMGTLLPNYSNVTYSSAGEISPLLNDPYFRTIGLGTKIFLGGAQGHVIGEGTQHSTDGERNKGVPINSSGTLMVKGDMKEMSSDYIRAATMPHYGSTLFVGIGIPIPILDEEMAIRTSISDEDLKCNVIDYGVPRRSRPVIRKTNYADLKTGSIEINGVEVPCSPLSSLNKAKKIALELKTWIEKGEFLLTESVNNLPSTNFTPKPLEIKNPSIFVRDVLKKNVIITDINEDIKVIANKLVENNVNHLPVVDDSFKLRGIITSWDIARALSKGKTDPSEIMTKKVIVANIDDPIDVVIRKIDENNISGIPIVDKEGSVKGLITAEDISRLMG